MERDRTLKSLGPCLEGHNIRCYTDNRNVTSIVQKGSKNGQLQEIAIDIHQTCEVYHLGIDVVWVLRERNRRADSLSRISDSDDWCISSTFFDFLDRKWGPHTFDRFACDYNTKCAQFNSRWGCPTSKGVDAFKQTWSNAVNWWVPPPRLAARVIDKAIQEKAVGTLIVPQWKSAPYWPKISQGGKFKSFVREFFTFSCNEVEKGRGNNGIFGSPKHGLTMLAVKFHF